MFPEVEIVHLRVVSHKDIYKAEEELVSIRLNINIPCEIPEDKYKMLYCFNCNKIICSDCSKNEHEGHQIEEKADYLAPAQLLMNRIFSNSSKYKADTRLSKYLWCIINDLEIKFLSSLKNFSTIKDETEANTNSNVELLKKFCVESFIELKNGINIKGIILDDEIFLTLYNK
jgi:hypothetical protein